jgi:hypothetical protein
VTNEQVVAVGIRLFGLLTVLNTLFSMLGIIPHSSAVLYDPGVGIKVGLMCVWLALGSVLGMEAGGSGPEHSPETVVTRGEDDMGFR